MSTSVIGIAQLAPHIRARSVGTLAARCALVVGLVTPLALAVPVVGAHNAAAQNVGDHNAAAHSAAAQNAGTDTATAEAGGEALPAGVDSRNYTRVQWGAEAGRIQYLYTPKLVEEGQPIRLVATGFNNIAGTAGAALGIKLDGGAVWRTVPLPESETPNLAPRQRQYVWQVGAADAAGVLIMDVEFPTAATANGLSERSYGVGTNHVITVNSGSLSASGIDPAGSGDSAAYKVIAPGTLEAELAQWTYTPTGQPDVWSGGGPAAAPRLSGGSAVDAGAGQVELSISGVTSDTWLHLTPLKSDSEALTATVLSGQWVKVNDSGRVVFRTGSLASGSYQLLVHGSREAGITTILGKTDWTHTGPAATATTGVTAAPASSVFTGPVFAGAPLTPWWTTPATSATRSTITQTRSTTPAPVAPAAAAPAAGGGTAPVVQITSAPRPVAAATNALRSSGSTAGPGTVRGASAATPVASGASSGLVDSASSLLTGSPELKAASRADQNLVLMVIAVVLLLLVGSFASALIVAGRFLPARRLALEEDK